MLVITTTIAQDKKKDTTYYPQRYGLRMGVDLNRLAKNFYDKNYKGFEIVGDYRLTKKLYLAAEIGNEQKTKEDDLLNYTTQGSYIKGGFDFNGYENWLDMENSIHIGLRGCFANFNQQLNNYTIYEPLSPFGTNTKLSGTEWKGLSASWIEVVGGFKAEIFQNCFMGISGRLNYLIVQKQPDGFSNLYIPGFNKIYENSKFGAGFNYTISYFIPLYKSKNK